MNVLSTAPQHSNFNSVGMFQSNMRHPHEFMMGGDESSPPPHYSHPLDLEPKQEYVDMEQYQHPEDPGLHEVKNTTNIGGYNVGVGGDKGECRVKMEPVDNQGYSTSLPPFMN